jgi:hypothetical protein
MILPTPTSAPRPKPLKGMLRPNLSEAKWVDDGTKEGNWEGVFFEMYDGENWMRIKNE